MDGDGRADLLVNGAYLVLGPVTGTLDLSLATAELVGGGGASVRVSGAGDVNDDGHDDLMVGAPSGGDDAGTAYLVLGSVSGTLDLSLADAKLVGEETDNFAGCAVSGAGDVDNDGHDDLLVGAYGNTEAGTLAGAAYVVLGPVTGTLDLAHADVKLVGERRSDRAGYSVSGAGDVDADGRADILVGAFGNDGGGDRAGATYLIYGRGL